MRMLLLKTWRDILSRKGQFAALVLLVTLGIVSYVAFISSYLNLRESIETANRELLFADFTTRVAEAPAGIIGRIRGLPGVSRAEGRLVVDTGLDLTEDEQATARVVGLPEGRRPRVDDVVVLEGRYLTTGARHEVLLHPKFAGETGLGTGDTITLRTDGRRERLRVVGIATAPTHLYPIRSKGEIPSPREFAIVYVSSEEAERLFQRAPTVTEIAVHVKPGADVNSVIDEVEDVLDPYTVLETTLRADEPSNFALNEELEQNRVLAQSMPILILSISALSLFIALSRIVTSQRGEIGLAKALGYSDTQILGHYLLFSLLVAAFGSIVGIALGLLSAQGLAYSYVSLLGIPFLETPIHPEVVFNAVALSVIACVLAGIVPAWASSRLPPAQAMHSDPNIAVKGGHVPVVERALGWAMPKTFTFRIPLRNVFRARRRSLYTIVGVAFAMVLTVTTVSMFDSVDLLFDKIFTQSERWDIVAAFEEQFGNDRVNE
ncbi:MAG: ABC transporter permease, partial [Coriobacteriales bacterium]|nr:ABC transporter permease [Coriobacteriales bacterium]